MEMEGALLLHLHILPRHDHLTLSSQGWLSSHILQTICPLSLPWWRISCDNFSLPLFKLPHLPFFIFMLHALLRDQRIWVFLHVFGSCSWLAFTHATRIKKTYSDTKLDLDLLLQICIQNWILKENVTKWHKHIKKAEINCNHEIKGTQTTW